MRSAIVHDWVMSAVGGAENCLEAIHRLFPSPIYALVKDEERLKGSYFEDLSIATSFIQRLPMARRKYRSYLPFFPMAIEQFDLGAFDLVISSSHCVAKGVVTTADQLHICYCHTPVRYAWDLSHEYLREAGLNRGFKGMLAKAVLHYLRGWDVHSAKRVDWFVANSEYVARRIEKFYGRSAKVIYPPVDVSFFQMKEAKESFYLAASRFVPYKKMAMIIAAFSKMPGKRLVVIGDGPDWKKVKEAASSNVELLGYQPNEVLRDYLQRARAFVFAAVEDFGILPIEAMASGTPVIAFGKGAVCETVIEGKTGFFYREQTEDALIDAVERFEKSGFDPKECRKQAEKFSRENFCRQFQDYVLEKYNEFSKR